MITSPRSTNSSLPIFDTIRYWVSRKGPRFTFRLHGLAYRLTSGRLVGTSGRMPLLLLTTVGRKSGRHHTWPLAYFRDGNHLVVIASNCGREQHPAWYLNVQARPYATVQIGRKRWQVIAKTAEPSLRTQLWKQAKALDPLYCAYEQTAKRQIPIVLLQDL